MSRFKLFGTVVLIFLVALTLFVTQQSLARSSSPGPLIYLKAFTFDPVKAEPQLSADTLATDVDARPSTSLIQFSGPVRTEWKEAVEAAGVKLYGYVPDYAFIARMDAATAAKVLKLPYVRWTGDYHPAYALSSDLVGLQTQDASAGPTDVVIQTLPDADLEELSQQINALGGVVHGVSVSQFAGYVKATLSPRRLSDLARADGVLWIEHDTEPVLYNDQGGGIVMGGYQIQHDLGLYGAGQIIGIADSGLDVGVAANLHPDLRGRVTKAYCLGRPNPCDWSDPNGHGTHVAGSTMGNGVRTGANPAAHRYDDTFAGVAPEARLVFQSTMDSQGGLSGIPDNMEDMIRQAYQDGARVHNNSWGSPTGGDQNNPEYGGYDVTSQQADAAAWNMEEMLILVAAGNQGIDKDSNGLVDPDSLGSPGTAKNVLTVGASENNRPALTYAYGDWWPDDYPANPIYSDRVANNINGLSAFSSRGPTDDYRIKPDVVAPGNRIISVSSQDPGHQIPGPDQVNADYRYMDGTSMATPLTTGAAAIVREWLVRLKGIATPSGALVKAVMINGSANMSPGQYGTGNVQEIPAFRPNPIAGWGRVDLVGSLNPGGGKNVWVKDVAQGLATGGSSTFQLTVGGGQQTSGSSYADANSEPAETTATNLIQNGGFESGAAWVMDSFERVDFFAHSGTWSAGSWPGFDGYIYQLVDIPTNTTSATLNYYWYNEDADVGYDELVVSIYSGDLSTVLETFDYHSTDDQTWHGESFNLNGMLNDIRGETIAVVFEVLQDNISPDAGFYVDDVALLVEAGSSPTATPTTHPTEPTPTPTATPTTGSGGGLRITLAWTDYPGELSVAKALVNDLDLEVIAPDGSHHVGNAGLYVSGSCLRGNKWDNCNNVEGVILSNAPNGTYTVIVRGSNVPHGPQTFALAAVGSNLREGGSATPTQTPAPGLDTPLYLPLIAH